MLKLLMATSLRGVGVINGLRQTVVTKIPYTDLNLIDRLLEAGIKFTGVESKLRFGQMIFSIYSLDYFNPAYVFYVSYDER